jgi:hypothetical protein
MASDAEIEPIPWWKSRLRVMPTPAMAVAIARRDPRSTPTALT